MFPNNGVLKCSYIFYIVLKISNIFALYYLENLLNLMTLGFGRLPFFMPSSGPGRPRTAAAAQKPGADTRNGKTPGKRLKTGISRGAIFP